MKKSLLLALFFLIPSQAFAQTNTFPSSGDVGIGTTSPAGLLDVHAGTNENILSRGPVDLSSGTTIFSVNDANNATEPLEINSSLLVINPSGGGVSIGTTSTSGQLLTHAGTNENLNLLGPVDLASGASLFSVNDAINATENLEVNSSLLVINPNGGDVGIGTTSPANLLDIGTGGGIHIASGTPGSTSAALYNNAGALTWNGNALATATPSSVIMSGGQLQCSGGNCSNSTGSGTIQYCPYKGNIKTTASQGNYTIPSACLTATLTSMYVGGTGSSSVSASTLYYIYLWNTSGTWVLDAETTGHATDSSTGIEIKSSDDTKTLVGMIHTDANKHVMTGGETSTAGDTNTVATWDNRTPTVTFCQFTALRQIVVSGGPNEINSENRCNFMSWGDAAVFSSQQTFYTIAGTSYYSETRLELNGTTIATNLYQLLTQPISSAPYHLALPTGFYAPSEGYYYTEMLCGDTEGETTSYLASTPTTVLTIQ